MRNCHRPSAPFCRVRLHRRPGHGKIAGVCAGIAEALEVEPFLIRLAFVVALLTLGPVAVLAYIIAAVALPKQRRDAEVPDPWATSAPPPAAAPDAGIVLSGLRERFRDQEKRVENLEAYVATREFELNRAIRDLDRSTDEGKGDERERAAR